MNYDYDDDAVGPTYYVIRAGDSYVTAPGLLPSFDIAKAIRFPDVNYALDYLSRGSRTWIGPLALIRVDEVVTEGSTKVELSPVEGGTGEIVIVTELSDCGIEILLGRGYVWGYGIAAQEAKSLRDVMQFRSLDAAAYALAVRKLPQEVSLVGIRRAARVSTPGSTQRTLTDVK